MKYFKNTELAKIYGVSEKSVRNWIQATHEEKLDLQLYSRSSRFYIADTSKNITLIEQQVKKGKKYKNTRAFKIVEPRAKFYDLYNTKQAFDIISNLDIYRELPRQYNYFDGGAVYWDKYVHRLANENTPNILTSTIKLLDVNMSYLDDILIGYKHVNVVDIGTGNALPIRNLLAHLLNNGKLGRYIALDISCEMLDIAKKSIRTWFNGKVIFEGHEIDINYDRFTDVLASEYLKQDAKDTINLVLVLGGTLGNLRSPDGAFKVIHDSMGRNDLFIQTIKLDTDTTRRYFDFNVDSKLQPLPPQYKFLVDLLNIDESFYAVELGYEEKTNSRYLRLRLKIALSIKFKFDEGERIVELSKDDSILLWRYWHQDASDVLAQLDANDFHALHMSQTANQEYVITIAPIKSRQQ